jgi:cold shock protein
MDAVDGVSPGTGPTPGSEAVALGVPGPGVPGPGVPAPGVPAPSVPAPSVGGTGTTWGSGIVIRFDPVKGYGFVTPDGGGDDVFVHVNSVAGDKQELTLGARVDYEAMTTDRGIKALVIRVRPGGLTSRLGPLPPAPASTPAPVPAPASTQAPVPAPPPGSAQAPAQGPAQVADDELCDVLSERDFLTVTTEVLLANVPDLTAAQVLGVRQQMLALARRHSWVDG